VPLHEKPPLQDSELHNIVAEGVAAHDNLAIGTIMRECHDVFVCEVQSLTDCCGGDGTTMRTIIRSHPK
jgi:hypothetical protein